MQVGDARIGRRTDVFYVEHNFHQTQSNFHRIPVDCVGKPLQQRLRKVETDLEALFNSDRLSLGGSCKWGIRK